MFVFLCVQEAMTSSEPVSMAPVLPTLEDEGKLFQSLLLFIFDAMMSSLPSINFKSIKIKAFLEKESTDLTTTLKSG